MRIRRSALTQAAAVCCAALAMGSAQATDYTITTSAPGWEMSLDGGISYAPATSLGNYTMNDGRTAAALWPFTVGEFITVRFRYQFNLDGPVTSATLRTAEDDDAAVRLNGALAFEDTDNFAGSYGPVNVTGFLGGGANTFQADVISYYCCGRGFAAVLDVSTAPVPEPGSWALMACGLAAMGGYARRTRRRDQAA